MKHGNIFVLQFGTLRALNAENEKRPCTSIQLNETIISCSNVKFSIQ